MKKNVSLIIIALLLLCLLSSMLNIEPSKAVYTGTIYIRANGAVDPSFAPILNNGNILYTFDDNIRGSIVVQRNNIVINGAGHNLEYAGNLTGIDLSGRSNVTVKNLTIEGFTDGILIQPYPDAHNNTIMENKITNNTNGIRLWWNSYNNTISGNAITKNVLGVNSDYTNQTTIFGNSIADNNYGLFLDDFHFGTIFKNNIGNNSVCGVRIQWSSQNNRISENRISNNKDGVSIDGAPSNIIFRNIIANNNGTGLLLNRFNGGNISENKIITNNLGISLLYSLNNLIYHNNLEDNKVQAVATPGYVNAWNDSYPSGGNYWTPNSFVDKNHDEIGDTPYYIIANNTDYYPLMNAYPSLPITLTGITVISGGSGYTTPHIILEGGGGTGATATARVSNGVIFGIVLTNPGNGYTSVPNVVFRDPSPRAKGASATVAISPIL
jgi:parallel beta-helix repeat protein